MRPWKKILLQHLSVFDVVLLQNSKNSKKFSYSEFYQCKK